MTDIKSLDSNSDDQNALSVKNGEWEKCDSPVTVCAARNDIIRGHEKTPYLTGAKCSEMFSNYSQVCYPCQFNQGTLHQDMQSVLHKKDQEDAPNHLLILPTSNQIENSSQINLDISSAIVNSGISPNHIEMKNANQINSITEDADLLVSTSHSNLENSTSVCHQTKRIIPSSGNKLHIPDNNSNNSFIKSDLSKAWSNHPDVNYKRNEINFCDIDMLTRESNFIQLDKKSFDCYEGLIGAVGGSDLPLNETKPENKKKCKWGDPPHRLGLLGGGESSLNNSTSTWDAPPSSGPSTSGWSSNSNGTNSGQWNSEVRQSDGVCTGQIAMSPPKQHGTWAQAAGKGLSPTAPVSTPSSTSSGNNDQVSNNGNGVTKVRIEEHISDLRIAAAYSDGWGQTTVNQDSSWDLPPSPQPSSKEGNSSIWRAPINNGTEIWEINIRNRNKGVGTPASSSGPTQPWGHTPSTHIGGTWGEEEDTTNMWTGPGSSGSVHVGGGDGTPEKGNNVWGKSTNKPPGSSTNSWSSEIMPKRHILSSGWQEPSPPTNRRQIGMTNYDDGTSIWGNPQQQGKVSYWKDMPNMKPISSGGGPANNKSSSGGTSLAATGSGMIHLPSPITSGNKPEVSNSIWGKPPLPNHGTSLTEMPAHDSLGNSVWEDTIKSTHVKTIPTTPGTPFGGMGGTWDPGSYWSAKPKSASSSSWTEGQINACSWSGPSRPSTKPLTKDIIWASKPFCLLTEMGFKKNDVEHALKHNNMNLEDALSDLQSMSSRDMHGISDKDNVNGIGWVKMKHGGVSDEFGINDHSMEPSFGPLNYQGSASFQGSQMMCGFDGGSQIFKPPLKNQGFSSNTPSLLNPAIGSQSSSLNMGNSFSGLNPALVQKILQQQQQQQQLPPVYGPVVAQNGLGGHSGRLNHQNLPSAAQLKHLVQQIQMAVQAGHLNPQILNQPLAPQTLQLLYQLLQQIKVLHQFQQQLIQSQPLGKGNSSMQMNLHITQTKQRILNLQNQIASQQALFLKQQQLPHQATVSSPQLSSNELFKPTFDPMSTLNPDLRDLSLKDSPFGQSQSRLPHWKNSFLEKEDVGPNPRAKCGGSANGSESFSRAPGTVAKPMASTEISSFNLSSSHSSQNLHPFLAQGDSTWSSLSGTRVDWPESSPSVSAGATTKNSPTTSISNSIKVGASNGNGNLSIGGSKDSSSTTYSAASSKAQLTYNLNDLVAEFEPGKPWKGHLQMKNIEDDPHVTPGSVKRSPLSLNTIKDSDIFSWSAKSSPSITNSSSAMMSSLSTTLPGANNCWTCNPPTSKSSSNFNKQANLKSSWSALGSGSDVWGAPTPKTRGPPPGLISQGRGLGGSWNTSHGGSHQSWGPSFPMGWDTQNTSLILKNLTPQIDGSTLKTLCMQHGPLQLFHLLLNHGISLVCYSTREEAAKAQSALNNCVLGNTTILADIPSEAEVQQYLQLASSNGMVWASSQPSGNSNTATPGFRNSSNSYPFSGHGNGASSWLESNAWHNPNSSQLWAFPGSGGSLWGTSPFMTDRDQNTRSLMNSFLPGDLLGSESM
ncbi:protein Gawky-like isoform X3 [Limulus polyphemus]|uniref:Protein Gawky-like isoform X3 n=1 Tax=Limulus polyphemus TaxID=6850 RepID=A0ABM1TE67_LIMPO|nr:protein Gawky-like isoform X3 [Limulus polyphemus]